MKVCLQIIFKVNPMNIYTLREINKIANIVQVNDRNNKNLPTLHRAEEFYLHFYCGRFPWESTKYVRILDWHSTLGSK